MTTMLESTSKHAQLAAIRSSGIDQEFKLIQLRNPVFWVFVWAMLTGTVRLVGYYQPQVDNYGGALVAGTAAFGIYTVAWIAFLHHLDRFTPLPARLLATGFVWGAVVATTFLALTVNGAVLTLYTKLFGTAWAQDWAAGFTAPFTEETAKAIGFIMLLGLAPRLMRSAFDGFIAGAFIGLGLQVAEDVLYVFQGAGRDFGTNQTAESVQIIVLRGVTGVVSHAMFSALVCSGLMWILGRDPRGRHVGKGIGLILVGAAMHFAWDCAGAIGVNVAGSAGALLIPLLVVVGITLVVFVGKDAAGSERQWARDILGPEVDTGLISAAERDAVAGTHKDRRRFVKAVDGHHDRKAARHMLAAAQELGVAIGRSNGEEAPGVMHAREELNRLRNR